MSKWIELLFTILLLLISISSISQIPDLSKTLYRISPEDSINITNLINHGVEIKKGRTVAWFPKDSLSINQMNEFLDTINIGITAAEKMIGAPLPWQYYSKQQAFAYFFRLDSFISHTNGNFINIRFQLVRQGMAPWLHQAMYTMLEAKADDSIPFATWKQNKPKWLEHGLAEYISREVYQQLRWTYFDLSKKPIKNIDSACKEDLKDEAGKYALSDIGRKGIVPNTAERQNRKYIFAYYHCSCSFTKYLVKQKGLSAVLNSFSASPYVQQEFEKSTHSSLDTLKSSWLMQLHRQ